ncbi:hypothetical protein [Roseovarius sp. E0-M6]|uniref:hypothetical protein n=1 Tax=Roseovarius sp. E0-M6 TaxID=3127118 RepID=UPI00300FEC06
MNDEEATSDLTAELDLGFDGAEDILRAWEKGLRPDPVGVDAVTSQGVHFPVDA